MVCLTFAAARTAPYEVLYRHVLLDRVSDDIFASSGSDEERAVEALRRFKEVAPSKDTYVIDGSPAATLVRGGGYCDSLSMAFVQLAERAGFRGRLTFLYDDAGVSPHSVAELLIDGEWRVFDALSGRVTRTASGELSTTDDIASGAAPVTIDTVESDLYAHAVPKYVGESDGGRLRGALRWVSARLADISPQAVQALYLRGDPPSIVDTSGVVREDWTDPGDRAFWLARHEHLFGDTAAASRDYQRAIDLGTSNRERAQGYLDRLAP